MTTFVDDIFTNLVPPPETYSARKLGNYRHLVKQHRNDIYSNAKAYLNLRVHTRRFPDALLRRILKDATFIPAHPNRYRPGEFQLEGLKYFVIHRPGSDPNACTLVNIILIMPVRNLR